MDNLFEDDGCVQCEECGHYYPRSFLKRCKVCGKVVCGNCRPQHTHYREISIPIKPILERTSESVAEYGGRIFSGICSVTLDVLEFILCAGLGILRYVGLLGVIGAVLIAGFFMMSVVPFDDTVIMPGFDDIDLNPNPHIVPADEFAGQFERKTLYFDWRGTKRTVTAEIDMAVYHGSLSDLSHRGASSMYDWWTRKCLDSLQDDFYEDVLSDLREIRTTQNLNSDEYVELITSFVQSIPYDYGALDSARYPIAVFYEGRGDCDEKSIFLCGLLAKEGYDVALFDLPSINHMSAAIKAHNTDGYVDGYVYIEATNPHLIGEVPVFDEGKPDKYPEYYVVGDGEMMYLKYNEVQRILQYKGRFDDFMDDWKKYLSDSDIDRYNTYVQNYNYIMNELNAGEREKAYSIVEAYPLIV